MAATLCRSNKNRRTLLREAEADIAHAKDGTEILDCLYVMETGISSAKRKRVLLT